MDPFSRRGGRALNNFTPFDKFGQKFLQLTCACTSLTCSYLSLISSWYPSLVLNPPHVQMKGGFLNYITSKKGRNKKALKLKSFEHIFCLISRHSTQHLELTGYRPTGNLSRCLHDKKPSIIQMWNINRAQQMLYLLGTARIILRLVVGKST